MKYRMRWFDAEWHNAEYTNWVQFMRAVRNLIKNGMTVEVLYS
jgi:hypothetical protein